MAVSPWLAGQRITADRLNDITPIWQSWTPTWTVSSGTAPAFGNAVLDCQYCQVGDMVTVQMTVTFGSTSTYGDAVTSANWRFSLPVTADTSSTRNMGMFELEQSTDKRVAARATLVSTTTFEFQVTAGYPDGTAVTNSGVVDSVTPFGWANGDSFSGTFTYQAA